MERLDPSELLKSLKAQKEANAKQLRRARRIVADINSHLVKKEPDGEGR